RARILAPELRSIGAHQPDTQQHEQNPAGYSSHRIGRRVEVQEIEDQIGGANDDERTPHENPPLHVDDIGLQAGTLDLLGQVKPGTLPHWSRHEKWSVSRVDELTLVPRAAPKLQSGRRTDADVSDQRQVAADPRDIPKIHENDARKERCAK